MKKNLKYVIFMILASMIACGVFGALKMNLMTDQTKNRVWHHKTNTADSVSGITEIPENHMVDETFTSHLPIVVLDTNGQEVENQKYYDAEWDTFRYKKDVDPYVNLKAYVYDSEGNMNHINGKSNLNLQGYIKVRGNSSASYSKKQYRLKITDEDGNKVKIPFLGMEDGSEWILNGNFRDATHLRNYLSFNLAAEMGLDSPDVRFCEVLMKRGNQYEYLGLYLAEEPVEVGKGRIEFAKDYRKGEYSYVVVRDRMNPEVPPLNTWTFQNGIDVNWADGKADLDGVYNLVYPKNEKRTEEAVDFATKSISEVEKAIYSDDVYAYSSFSNLINVDSFVNHYILGESIMGFEFMRHSTYFYREAGGKFTVGPVWDFDLDYDNTIYGKANLENRAIAGHSMYNRLLLNHTFYKKVMARYHYLRKNLLSNENISEIAKDLEHFLGNALLRDQKRWSAEYETSEDTVEKNTDIVLKSIPNDANYETYVNQMLDAYMIHADYLDKNIDTFEANTLREATAGVGNYSFAAILFIFIFFLSIFVSNRLRNL